MLDLFDSLNNVSTPVGFMLIAALALALLIGIRWGVALEKSKTQSAGDLTDVHFFILFVFAAFIGGIFWYVQKL